MSLRQILILIPALMSASCIQKNAPEAIHIGHVAPLSGPLRSAGELARQGTLVGVEEINGEDARIHGRKVAVVHADDRGEAEAAQAEAVRLATVNRVAALLGGANAAEAEAIAKAGQSQGLPVVALAPLPSLPSGEGVLSLAPSPAYQGKILGRFASEELKPARVGIVTDARVSFDPRRADAFAKEFPRERVERWDYPADSGLSELVQRLKKAAPPVLMIAAPAPDFLKLTRLLKDASVKTILLYGGPESESPLIQADPEASAGVHLASTYWAESNTPGNQEFIKKLKEPANLDAAQAYDGLRLLAEAMRRARTLDPAVVRKEMTKIDRFSTVTGTAVFSKDLHARRTQFIVRWEEGQPKLVKSYEAME